jgi:colicin import membrane protein
VALADAKRRTEALELAEAEARKAHRDELSQAQARAEAERKAHKEELAQVRAEGAVEAARVREELAKVREELAEVRKAKLLLAPHKTRKDGTLEG